MTCADCITSLNRAIAMPSTRDAITIHRAVHSTTSTTCVERCSVTLITCTNMGAVVTDTIVIAIERAPRVTSSTAEATPAYTLNRIIAAKHTGAR
mmetsp:Transcript_20010/g.39324  ORF Transcript_20010/g.39324 Transcript_20010/m.39324 type:complete len:95 (-) Transcript_20010:262-546(-)